ncbi:MAG: hypothetical protein JWN03_3694 [Nocardia sp.]|uniref:hypothetical protein n=1 Tax=Nocardia sp. TaxID=1821 RepID=UPI002623BA4C|nr:hypothetical protein [Nocardia sp.]MCU1643419.1 hypothetical protein [Nocardia sp.]
MTPTEVPSWSDVRGLGADPQVLYFTVDAAKIGLNACTELMWSLLVVQDSLNRTDSGSICNPYDFAGPPGIFRSGPKWADVFRTAGLDLRDKVNSHIDIVNAMADSFKFAAKKFVNTEAQSVDDFNSVTMPNHVPKNRDDPNWSSVPTMPSASDTGIYKNVSGKSSDRTSNIPSADSLQASVENDRKSYEHYTAEGTGGVQPEWGYDKSLHWKDFYDFGESIISERVMTLAVDWEKVRIDLDAAFKKFESQKEPMFDGWRGRSADKGGAAVTAVINDGNALTAKIQDIENRLVDAYGWLRAAHLKMPKVPQPHVEDKGNHKYEIKLVDYTNDTKRIVPTVTGMSPEACEELATNVFRAEFQDTYVQGIESHNKSLASFEFPPMTSKPGAPLSPPPPPQIADPPPKITPGAGTPGSGTPGGGTPSSPGSPTLPDDTTPKDTNPKDTTPKDTTPANTNDQTLSTVVSAVESLAKEGASLVESLAQQGATLAQQGIQSVASLLTSQQTTQQTPQTTTEQQVQQQLADLTSSLTSPGPSSLGGSPSGVTSGGPTTTVAKDNQLSRLFPRAGVAVSSDVKEEAVSTGRAGLAASSTTSSSGTSGSGTPMGSGANAGGQGAAKEHKRPEYLRSGENLEEVFGTPEAVLPVAEK